MGFILLGVRAINDDNDGQEKCGCGCCGGENNPNVTLTPVDTPAGHVNEKEAPCAMVDGEAAKKLADIKTKFMQLDKELFERLEEKNFMGRLMKGQFTKDNFSELAECFGILTETDCKLCLIEDALEEGIADTEGMGDLHDLAQHVGEFRSILDRMAADAETCMDNIRGIEYDDDDDEDGFEDDEDEFGGEYDDDNDDDDEDMEYQDYMGLKDDWEEILNAHAEEVDKLTARLDRHQALQRLLGDKLTLDNYEEFVSLATHVTRVLLLSIKAQLDLEMLPKQYADVGIADAMLIAKDAKAMEEEVEALKWALDLMLDWMDAATTENKTGSKDDKPEA